MASRSALVMMSRGDPGIFSIFKRLGRGVVGAVKGFAGLGRKAETNLGALRTAAGGGDVGASGTRTAAVMGTGGAIPIKQAGLAGAAGAAIGRVAPRLGPVLRTGGKLAVAGAVLEAGGQLFDAVTGAPIKKRRRMNVLNPRALSRATRRLAGFNRRTKTVEKVLRRLAPPRRRSIPVHGHHLHKGLSVVNE